MSTADLLLPGQPLPARFNSTPTPQPGSGCYLSPNGKLVASIVGVPIRDGSVGGPEELRGRNTEGRSKLTFCWLAKIVSVKSRHEMSAVPEIGAIVSFQNPITLTSCHSLKALNHPRRSVSSGHWHSEHPYNLAFEAYPAQTLISSLRYPV
jgi:hypothetical protein